MKNKSSLVRFDWAIKRLLRQKSNFVVLEGLLSTRQREQFVKQEAGDIYPEYYVLRVNEFDELAKTPLDEWIYFLKTGEIDEHATAKGLPEAREKLRIDKLSPSEKGQYYAHMEALRYQKSVIETGWIEGHADGRAEGIAEGQNLEKRQIAANLKKQGLPIEIIANCTGLSPEEIADC